MKKLLILAALLAVGACAFAQNNSLGDPDPESVGRDSALQALKEVSLDKFEREGSWNVHMSPDYGVITARLFEGAPAMKEPLEDDDSGESDTQALGVRVDFFRRGVNSFTIKAARPIPIEGTTKVVSVWVAGRNQSHDMYLLVQDYFGNSFELYMGNLGFSGWKKLSCVIPPSPDGVHGIIQSSAYYGDRPGLKVVGFRIDCNPMQARGSYYVYFDDLRAVTDLYDLQNRDEDDMIDNW